MTSIASLADVFRGLPATFSSPRRPGDFSAQKKKFRFYQVLINPKTSINSKLSLFQCREIELHSIWMRLLSALSSKNGAA